ncbi:MAG: hypothetical protein SFU53_03970 [Terrimicrobiaceae bacterium]|nr:hypothetical protein [Terrimicrobiaceae bacterium]
MRRFIPLAAAACLAACKPAPPAQPAPEQAAPTPAQAAEDSGPVSPTPADEKNPLHALQNASMEMALDAFQFGKPGIGWPADVQAPSAAEFLALAVRENYLPADLLPHLQGVRIANAAEDDSLHTALASLPRGKKVLVIRKDGAIAELENEAMIPGFAALPAREPIWLR